MSIVLIVLIAALLLALQVLMVRLCDFNITNNSKRQPCILDSKESVGRMKEILLKVDKCPIEQEELRSVKLGPKDFLYYALHYSKIDFGNGAPSFDRLLLKERYKYNSEYVMIGWYQENVPALMKVSREDGRVYVDDYEDSSQGEVEEIAPSIDGYLAKCYEISCECRHRGQAPVLAHR